MSRYVIVCDDCPSDETEIDCWILSELETEHRVGWEIIETLLRNKPIRVPNRISLLRLLWQAGHSSTNLKGNV